MAVGDEAVAAGYPLVPDTGEEGKRRWGAREINRTRDFIAQVKTSLTAHNLSHNGPVSGRPWTIHSSSIGNPVGDGIFVVSYGVTFTTTPWPVVSSGSAGAYMIATGNNPTGFNVYVYNLSSGAAIVTSGSYRVNWTVTGIIA